MRILTHAEKLDWIRAELETQGAKVPGRSLPKGHQWNGLEVAGTGKAAARRRRQAERLRDHEPMDSDTRRHASQRVGD